MIAKLLEDVLKKSIPKTVKDVALLLSGGVDSISVGFALEKIHKRVHAYTFQLDDTPTSDSLGAQRVSETMGWEFNLVKIPTVQICTDFLTLIQMGCNLKTRVENTYPFLHVIPAIPPSQRYVCCGFTADIHYGLSKKVALHFKHPKSEFDYTRTVDFNKAKVIKDPIEHVINFYGKTMIDPYKDDSIIKYFMQMDWDEINKPFQKHHIITDYKDWFDRVGIKRGNHQNLQLVAKIPELFEEKILKSDMNFKRRKRMLDVIRDYAKVKSR